MKPIIQSLTALVLVAALGGCYSYQPPPKAVESDNYTTIPRDEQFVLPGGVDTLTLDLAQQIAVENSPTFIAAKHAMAAAYALFYQSLSSYLPTSTGGYSIGNSYSYPTHFRNSIAPGAWPTKTRTRNQQFTIQSQWLIFDGLMRTMNMLASLHTAREYDDLADDSRRLLRLAVANAYNDVLLAMENFRIAKADLDFQNKMLQETQLKYDAGAVALTDVLNFEVRATEAENSLVETFFACRISKFKLSKLMGLTNCEIPNSVKFQSIDSIDIQLLTQKSYYFDAALQQRPDLKAYREALRTNEYYLYSAWGSLSPKVYAYQGNTFGFSRTQYRNSRTGMPPFKANQNNYEMDLGGEVEWTLFQGGKRFFDIREAQALVAYSEYQQMSKWLQVITEVRQAYTGCQESAAQLHIFQRIQDASRKNRDLVEEEYKAGNAPITRLNQAQTDLVRAEANLASARINVLNSRAQLDASIGFVDGHVMPEK